MEELLEGQWCGQQNTVYMWQSRVEIEGYSVTYFDCIAAFKVLYR